MAGSGPPINALRHDLNDWIVVGADLQIAFPRHRQWLQPLHSRSSEKNITNA